MAAVVGTNPILNNDIRTLSQTKRIRVTEFFQDYDKLRSGFVTGEYYSHFGRLFLSIVLFSNITYYQINDASHLKNIFSSTSWRAWLFCVSSDIRDTMWSRNY